MTRTQTIQDLEELYACEWLENRGRFTRVTTAPEESAWYCQDCGSTDCDPYDNICNVCDEWENEE